MICNFDVCLNCSYCGVFHIQTLLAEGFPTIGLEKSSASTSIVDRFSLLRQKSFLICQRRISSRIVPSVGDLRLAARNAWCMGEDPLSLA